MTNFVAGIVAVAVAGITAVVILIPGLEKELRTFDVISNAASQTAYERGDSKSLTAALQKHQAAARAFDRLSAKAKDERSSVGAVHRGMVQHLQSLLSDARAMEKTRSDVDALVQELGAADDFQRDGDWLDKACALRSKARSPQLEDAIERARHRRERHFFASIQSEFEKCLAHKSFGRAKALVDEFLKHSQLPDERAKAQARRDLLVPEAREALSSVMRECRGLRRLGMSREQILKEFGQRTKNNFDIVLPKADLDECIKKLSFE